MHQNFYHWHNRAELKPESKVLQARWDAAANFAEKCSGNDICSLLRIALFGTAAAEFVNRFSGELVKLEPTFLPENNAELLRVMSTAALYSLMVNETQGADAVALGLSAAGFHPSRTQPVCKELAQRATEYLASESERVRPNLTTDSDYQELERSVQDENWGSEAEDTILTAKTIVEIGKAMRRIAEENQFSWWLLGRRSSLLSVRRENLPAKEYALLAGAEAVERVALLPPPASVEALIEEVLSQCKKGTGGSVPLGEIIGAANIVGLSAATTRAEVGELCPLRGLVEIRLAGRKIDGEALERFGLPAKHRISPSEAANQYFRELIFIRALKVLN